MEELAAVLIAVVLVTGLIAVAGSRAELVQRRIEQSLTYLSIAVILFVLVFVLAEVVMRYVFNSPIPGHLEGSELLLPMIVFFAVSYTQARNGHVGMTLVVDRLSPSARRVADIAALVLSALTCAVLAYFGAKQAYFAWEIEDVTMTPPYWPIWPSAAAVPIGYLLLAVRMALQALQMVMPRRFPPPISDDTDLPAAAE